ncbi:pyridoxamine 5'-phosphate oxidase [Marisediminicola sp. LYQ134]|uniref:pyridoxamine 5'-phosphate oxidase n=1 Tax=unclassified Marisediminicola TaxID=2618316 RepID=UPI003983AAFA
MDSLDRHTDYGSEPLDEADVGTDPMATFRRWLEDAEAHGLYEPNAMIVSTVDAGGTVSSRTVLLKGLDATGFEFVTNYSSRKGRALLANPAVSIVFPWFSMQRQVVVVGHATPASADVSDAYFAARPRGSQIAALASEQSQPITSRDELEARVRELETRFAGERPVPRPEGWGAFRVTPSEIEFWHGRTSRLHDRLRFTAEAGGWHLERLQP